MKTAREQDQAHIISLLATMFNGYYITTNASQYDLVLTLNKIKPV